MGLFLFLCLAAICLGALADLSVVQTSCNILVYGDECRVYCCAQVHNDSNGLTGMESGVFQLMNGDEVIAEESVDRLWPYFLDPGKDGYIFGSSVFYPDENGNLEVPTITGLVYQLIPMDVPVATENHRLEASMQIEKTQAGGYELICELTNMEEETAWNPLVSYGLYTSGGSMLYADGITLNGLGIRSGSTIELQFTVNAQIVSQWAGYGVEPAEVRVMGYYRKDSD